jgi:hypothetical protein
VLRVIIHAVLFFASSETVELLSIVASMISSILKVKRSGKSVRGWSHGSIDNADDQRSIRALLSTQLNAEAGQQRTCFHKPPRSTRGAVDPSEGARTVAVVDPTQLVGVERQVAGPILVVAVEKETGTAELVEAAVPIPVVVGVEVVEVAVPILVVVGVEVVEAAVPRLVEVVVGIGSSSAGAVERLIVAWQLQPRRGRHGRCGHCECDAIYKELSMLPGQRG